MAPAAYRGERRLLLLILPRLVAPAAYRGERESLCPDLAPTAFCTATGEREGLHTRAQWHGVPFGVGLLFKGRYDGSACSPGLRISGRLPAERTKAFFGSRGMPLEWDSFSRGGMMGLRALRGCGFRAPSCGEDESSFSVAKCPVRVTPGGGGASEVKEC